MNVGNVNTGAVNWESLLAKIGDVGKTGGADGVGKTTLTITRNADGAAAPVSIAIPDDLELPGSVDQAAIDSLCEKLAADTGLNLTGKQIADFHDALTDALAEVAGSVGSSPSKNAMFDLYKLMALLVEVAQKQRDASREMRQAENQTIQKSILDQAEMQRDAALTGMIAGAVCCAIQTAVSIGVMAKQGSAYKEQVNTLETSGVNDAKTTLAQASESLKSYQADVMQGADANGVPLTPEARQAKIDALKIKVQESSVKLDRAQSARQTDVKFMEATRTIERMTAVNGIVNAIGNLSQNFVQNVAQIQQAEATKTGAVRQQKEEELNQTKDLFDQAQTLVNSVVQLMQAIRSAETQSMRDAIQA